MLTTARHWLVDAHVHFHDCFAPADFFSAAAGHVRAAGVDAGALLFTESEGVHRFRRLRDEGPGAEAAAAGWRISPTGEPISIVAASADGPPLLLVAGRQIVCAEGVELLALGTDEPIPDGTPLDVAAARTREVGAVGVLPWGFGKWTGRRGRVVAEALARAGTEPILLGDNGGRLAGTSRPALFAEAERMRVPVLPGSDPLPFPEQVRSVGRYGFLLECVLGADRPAAVLLEQIATCRTQPCPFGRLQSLPGFLGAQLRMQLRKRRRPAGP